MSKENYSFENYISLFSILIEMMFLKDTISKLNNYFLKVEYAP